MFLRKKHNILRPAEQFGATMYLKLKKAQIKEIHKTYHHIKI